MLQQVADWRAVRVAAIQARIARLKIIARRVAIAAGLYVVALTTAWMCIVPIPALWTWWTAPPERPHAAIRPLDPTPSVAIVVDRRIICRDGTESFAKHRGGACSNHGGIRD